MRKKIFTFLAGVALATGMIPASAESASVATIPAGMIKYPILHGTSTYLSLPLTSNQTFSGTVSSVTANTISVGDAPAPFTSSLATASAPYFVKFLSGNETGRVVLITSNTSSVLTLDTTDHATGSPVPLNTASFDVQVGDNFEIFPGDTLASIFGAGTSQSPLVLSGSNNIASADTVSLFTSLTAPAVAYYFNTTNGYWMQYGVTGNANNTIIYPYSAFAVTRQSTNPDTALVLGGRVTSVAAQTKVASDATIFTSTHFATDVTLSQLQFSNWTTGTNVATADTLGVWNATEGRFDTYYQKPDSTWRKYPDAVTDQSGFTITAGTVVAITKQNVVAGATTFVQSPLPYTLD